MKVRFARLGKLAGSPLLLLSLFLTLLLPSFSWAPVTSEATEREAFETDYHNSHKPPLRLNASSPHGKLFIDRTVQGFFKVPAEAVLVLIAAWVQFRLLFCLFLKRRLLMPIKFTSMFMA
ncbi:hypothetical protein [Paenibacillus macerans]|uniref:hypothetical protein n=1 Tax=Paenibacillus macerans TaxID=44252 RepID=UPI00203D4DE7|nr:hypothetical protein [Paenibacillus macerans]MCM3700807.1 hypothetical protein [Paenibacillus macerans]